MTPLLGFRRMEAMTKHRSHSAAFKRQVAEEFIAGETLHALSKRHDISRQLIRIWVGKFEAGTLDNNVQAARQRQSRKLHENAEGRSCLPGSLRNVRGRHRRGSANNCASAGCPRWNAVSKQAYCGNAGAASAIARMAASAGG